MACRPRISSHFLHLACSSPLALVPSILVKAKHLLLRLTQRRRRCKMQHQQKILVSRVTRKIYPGRQTKPVYLLRFAQKARRRLHPRPALAIFQQLPEPVRQGLFQCLWALLQPLPPKVHKSALIQFVILKSLMQSQSLPTTAQLVLPSLEISPQLTQSKVSLPRNAVILRSAPPTLRKLLIPTDWRV